jgi:hypothetical protein
MEKFAEEEEEQLYDFLLDELGGFVAQMEEDELLKLVEDPLEESSDLLEVLAENPAVEEGHHDAPCAAVIVDFDLSALEDSCNGSFSSEQVYSPAVVSSTCAVCDRNLTAEVTKHSYFGANASTCKSCRGFFFRCIRGGKRRPQDFPCKSASNKDNNRACFIDSRSRLSCKHCRLKRCLEVGMNER